MSFQDKKAEIIDLEKCNARDQSLIKLTFYLTLIFAVSETAELRAQWAELPDTD